ncbi:MAG TPA: porin [Phenylobacterium sp.]|jgi:phosphate-selective porin OprO/OprP|uniref:OprO/OprP family phosphate-selective porin n=1 Tax=Phenylobacterium sp. TaxID=1871053 RepID=UPI002CC4192B|nr:porin [Phenylobacterium sp.]HXA38906.1 porin [Phenylobacterium sp.]
MQSRKSTLRRLLLAAAATSAIATGAHAQAAPDPRDAEIQELKAQVQALAAKLDRLEARANTPPVIQTPTAPASTPPAAIAVIAGGKPGIQSADGRFTANLHAVMQFDAADFQQATPGPTTADFRRGAAAADTSHARDLSSGTNFRRARLGIDGRAFGDWDYNALIDFGGAGEEDAAHIQELWVQYSGLKPFHVKVGAYPPSLGLEDQGSTNGMLFLERPAVADIARSLAGGDFREAAEIWGNGNWWYVNAAVTGRLVGVVNSQATGVSQPFDSQLAFIGRLGFAPIRTEHGMLEVGVHGSYVDRPADSGGPDTAPGATRYSVIFQERPELRVDGTRLISTGAISAQHAGEVGLEAAGQYGPVFLQSEYETFTIQRRNGTVGLSDPEFRGYYVEGSYSLTGERRRFNAANWAFDAPAVNHPFSIADRTWGAWELAARYSDIDLNYHAGAPGTAPAPDAVRGGEQKIWAGGLNWYPNAVVRFMLDYQDVRIDRLSPSATTFATPTGAQIGQHYHAISFRSQFAF